MRASAIITAAALAAAGCGFGVLDDGLADPSGLPSSGSGPYELVGDPILIDPAARLRQPALLARADGGLRLWYARNPTATPADDDELWAAEWPALDVDADADADGEPDPLPGPDVAPHLVLAAAAPWEAGRVAAPTLVAVDDTHLVLFYEAGAPDAPAIGRADSTDGGATWTRHPDPVLADAAAPSAVLVGATWELYVERGDAIWRATSADGLAFTVDDAAAIEARPELATGFDPLAVGDPDVVISVATTGRIHRGLFFTGTAPTGSSTPRTAIGYAGSFDGVRWVRAGDDPILETPNLAGPAALLGRPLHYLVVSRPAPSRDALFLATAP